MPIAGLQYREANSADIPAMAEIRVVNFGTEEYWRERIAGYLGQELHPQEASEARVALVCADGERVVGFIAGHLTRRFRCSGELQWISVRPPYQGRGIAQQLLYRLAEWFVAHDARRVCVDVQPSNEVARRFYRQAGATDLRPHWMVWEDITKVLDSHPR